MTAVECIRHGQPLTVRGRIVILAAGALNTPPLLLRSASAESPSGLANESGLVGRNLMRHLIDLYAVDLDMDDPMDNRRKEIAFNDFYTHDGGVKLGTVQSFGRLPPPAIVMKSVRDEIAESKYRWSLPLFRLVSPALRTYMARLIDERMTLATIVEDFPRPENRVELSGSQPGDLAIRYRADEDDQRRVARMRALMKGALGPLRYRLIEEVGNNQRIAHACGTCRFGDDPHTSVLDKYCRAHDLDNLYVVDSSFFPTSGGTNPSLTIAANALRVGAFLTGSATGI